MIRRFKVEDLNSCKEIISKCIKDYTGLNLKEKRFFEEVYTKKGYLEDKNNSGKIFVFEKDGKIIGMGMTENGWAKKLFIDPPYHNSGVGSFIFKKLEEEIKKEGYKEVNVYCFPNTITFCEHRGYHIVEQKVVKKRGIKIRLTHMKKGFIKEGILQKNENRNKIKGFSNNLQGR